MTSKLTIFIITSVAISILFYFLYNKIKRYKIYKKVLEDNNEDYTSTAKNIADSISKARVLYKEYIIKVHPDRFPNDPVKQKRASELSSMLTESKRNYKKLLQISKLIDDEMN